MGSREITLKLPSGCEGELVVDRRETLALKPAEGPAQTPGLARFHLPAGVTTSIRLRFS
jgi:hypothetical protein